MSREHERPREKTVTVINAGKSFCHSDFFRLEEENNYSQSHTYIYKSLVFIQICMKMSSKQAPTNQPRFTPLYRATQLENIHEQVAQNDQQQQQQQQPPPPESASSRKVLTKYMTVIGDGSDVDACDMRSF